MGRRGDEAREGLTDLSCCGYERARAKTGLKEMA
jgi:hypothetical protein